MPIAIVLGGVNGAGKSTAARALLAEQLKVTAFVNADEIARGLNAFAPETVAFTAGRVMLARLKELAAERADFAFETTLAGRTYVSFLTELKQVGYAVELHYFWLRSADLAVERVQARVRRGGHDIPELTIRQRYARSIRNLWSAYRTIADSWYLYDNSGSRPAMIAAGDASDILVADDSDTWLLFKEMARDG
jgi:predicted ABC-type ATPase